MLRAAAVASLLALGLATANAQLLDGTLDDIVNEQIDRQVEEDLAEQLQNAVEQQVEDDVADTVAQQVESEVVETIQQQVEGSITDTVGQQVESGVTDAIEQQLEGTIGETLEDALTDVVEGLGDTESELGEILGQGLDDVGQAVEGVGAGTQSEDGGAAATPAAAERFVAAIDDVGRSIERDVWVILVPAQFAAQIPGWGFNVRERRELAALDRVLLRVDAPEDRDIVQAALELTLDAPGTLVDFNHVYSESAEADPAAENVAALPASLGDAAKSVRPARARLAIGIIDSAVAVEHEALQTADIVQQDFVPFAGSRPLRHGTAVASILVGDAQPVQARFARARLYAASVFFEDDAGNAAATTASLVAALEWLLSEHVEVANMSLAGPPNRVLEAAIDAAAARGTIVVAAVGNNGPHGEALYPAAYENVVGVTAVDAGNRIYRYANRGRQVTFAAPGVRIKVARSTGGYGNESGTSMAAPYAAAVIAQTMAAQTAASTDAVLAALKVAAIDLGAKDFDDVFGYGLIAPVE
jgi:subtilisin family serine protease